MSGDPFSTPVDLTRFGYVPMTGTASAAAVPPLPSYRQVVSPSPPPTWNLPALPVPSHPTRPPYTAAKRPLPPASPSSAPATAAAATVTAPVPSPVAPASNPYAFQPSGRAAGTACVIVCDAEATGLRTDTAEIIEWAASCLQEDGLENAFCELVKPRRPIPADSTRIHHITDADVKDKDGWDKVGTRFVKWVQTTRERHHADYVILVAHNARGYDAPLLLHNMRRAAIPVPEDWEFHDSLELARAVAPQLPRHRLQDVADAFGIKRSDVRMHSALGDVVVLKRLLKDAVFMFNVLIRRIQMNSFRA